MNKKIKTHSLVISKKELIYQNREKQKQAAELMIANKKLVFQNGEKEKRAAELVIANTELAFQNKEKEKRAAELIVANKELAFQNAEKEKRAAELIIANEELAFQNEEKEKRAAELSLANSELKLAVGQFRMVVESSPNAMILINEAGVITLINSATERLFRHQRHYLVGKKVETLLPQRFRSQFSGVIKSFFEKAHTQLTAREVEWFGVREDNTEFPVEVGLNPIELPEGNMVLASIVDISERKIQEANKLKSEALEKERQLVEMKGKFISIASHEFRTPLSTILLATGFMTKYNASLKPEEISKKLQNIEKQVNLMTFLLDDVLDVGRGNAGMIKAQFREVSCEIFEKMALEAMKSLVTGHKLRYSLNCPYGKIMTDEKLIRSIIINLITNAVKFSSGAKFVSMTVACDEDNLTITIQDNGIGIPDENKKELFTSFSRGNNVGGIEGTGLGLSIVKKAVDLLNGTIAVNSTAGKGTEVLLNLPLPHG
ncbi:MAG: ATP-binding protein [Cyclobacteriaceae bacterium]